MIYLLIGIGIAVWALGLLLILGMCRCGALEDEWRKSHTEA